MRLIDADELLKHAYDSGAWKDVETGFHQRVVDIEDIEDAPTVKPSLYGQCWGCQCEPTENKRGQWIWDGARYHCSECFFHAYGNTLECLNGTYRFCPNCGAKMDESKGETKERKEDDGNLISNRKCSECLHAQNITGLLNYCHDCGAKMDEVTDDE